VNRSGGDLCRVLSAWRDEVMRQQYKRQRLKWANVVRQTLLEKRGAFPPRPLFDYCSATTLTQLSHTCCCDRVCKDLLLSVSHKIRVCPQQLVRAYLPIKLTAFVVCAALAGWFAGLHVLRTQRRMKVAAEALAHMHRLRRAWAAWQRRMRAPALADHARRITLTRRAFAALVCHVMARRRSRCNACAN